MLLDGNLNQDNMMYEVLKNPDGSQRGVVAAVFDGHGLLGERASQAAVNKMREICLSPRFNPNDFVVNHKDRMAALFEELQDAVLKEHETPPATYVYPTPSHDLKLELVDHKELGKAYTCSSAYISAAPIDFGCTAVIAIISSGLACVGNSGDACAVICTPDATESARLLTERHSALNPDEVARIHSDFAGKATVTPDGYVAPLLPHLCEYQLQTTRCLGHKLLRQIGIIHTPFITLVPLRDARALILCSDGVSDELSVHNMADRAVSASSAQEAANSLVHDAQDYAHPQQVDDCTAVVLHFKQDKISSSSASASAGAGAGHAGSHKHVTHQESSSA